MTIVADRDDPGRAHARQVRDSLVELWPRRRVALDVEGAFHENWIETGGIVEPDLHPRDESHKGTARALTVWSSFMSEVRSFVTVPLS